MPLTHNKMFLDSEVKKYSNFSDFDKIVLSCQSIPERIVYNAKCLHWNSAIIVHMAPNLEQRHVTMPFRHNRSVLLGD